jgi:hypothetical protein
LRFELILNTDQPNVVISPTTFNVDEHVAAPFNLVIPITFSELKLVLLVKKYDCPDKQLKLLNMVVDVVFTLVI